MFRHLRKVHQAGFTLIEMMVTLAIFVFMTALILSRYGTFNQDTTMTNLGYDVGLIIRTAQTYGVSVKNADPQGSENFTAGYGLVFVHSGTCGVASINTIVLYADVDNDGHYDCAAPGGRDRLVNSYTLKNGVTISQIVVCKLTGSNLCQIDPFHINMAKVDITFKRPDPGPVICYLNEVSVWECNPKSVYMVLTSADGQSRRTVTVRNYGYVAISD